jgi:hypothetical protein
MQNKNINEVFVMASESLLERQRKIKIRLAKMQEEASKRHKKRTSGKNKKQAQRSLEEILLSPKLYI